MLKSRLVGTIVVVLAVASCSSERTASSTTATTPATTPAGGTDASASTTTVAAITPPTSPPTSLAPVTTAVAATTPPTSAATAPPPVPTTVACRVMTDPSANVRRGDCGPAVEEIQSYLISKGFAISMDGQFGPGTETAVRQFQTQMGGGLPIDGVVGAMTWLALQSDDLGPGEG